MPVAVTGRYRTYAIVKLTGWTIEQVDNTLADDIDWLLAIQATEHEIEAELQRKANEDARGR